MSVLHQLRVLMPDRALTESEVRVVAEQQAARFLRIAGVTEPHVPGSIIAQLPRVDVQVRSGIPVSGSTRWDKGSRVWRIELRAQDAAVRQRFSLAHEFKHALDHPFIDNAYPSVGLKSGRQRAERICDYFAACLLMPRPWVKRAWASGVQQRELLADLFGVSPEAMARRLSDLGLAESPYRHVYFRTAADEAPASVYFRSARLKGGVAA